MREYLAKKTVGVLLGLEQQSALEEGIFRNQGEIHRWMYDRFSLRQMCSRIGFVEFSICNSVESSIEDFAEFELDAKAGQTRKPDSLFVECVKPRLSNPAAKRTAA